VWREIEQRMRPAGAEALAGEREGRSFVALVHGVTGSGKTEIYLRAVEATLAVGQRPSSSCPRLASPPDGPPVRGAFPRPGGGDAQPTEPRPSLRRLGPGASREADVVIGPRLALFAPISRLGLVVLDEAHDGSYKQSEPIPLPAYHARDVAIVLGS